MWSTLIGATSPGESHPDDDDEDYTDSQDGWEDDVIVDDSESMDDKVDENNNHHSAAAAAAVVDSPSNQNGGNVRRAFMGQITRLLERVTAPEEEDYDESEQQGDEWNEDEVLFNDDEDDDNVPAPEQEDKKVEDLEDNNSIPYLGDVSPVKSDVLSPLNDEDDGNAWGEVDDLLDEALEENEMPSLRQSIANAEAELDEALRDIHQQEAEYGEYNSDGLEEDAMEERQAILEIQREMKSVNPPVVDVTPHAGRLRATRSAATSVMTQWATEDGTRDSGPVGQSDDEEDIYREENEEAYGPVVDHVPHKPIPMRRTDSLAVQVNNNEIEEEDALDETIIDHAVEDDQSNDQIIEEVNDLPAVVDQTPSVAHSRKSHGESVDAILSVAGETTLVNGEEEESPEDYGPVVDQIPEGSTHAPRSGSVMPVIADDLSQDFKTDDAMDETIFAKGDASTIDENTVDADAWVEDAVDVDGDTSDGSPGGEVNQSADTTKISSVLQESPTRGDRTNLVDHTPNDESVAAGETNNDPSVVVLAADEDLTRDTGVPCDDEVFGEENELEYCPVVDHTPLDSSIPKPTSAVSLQVEAAALEEDFREDDAMDETCFGDTSVLGGGTVDEEVPDGWEEEDMKTQAVANPNLVDQTPSEWESPAPKNSDPSVAVLASIDESVNEEGSEYGLVVDQTPHTPGIPPASRSDSVIVQAADMETVEDETMNDDDDDGDTFTDEMPLGIGAVRSADDILVDRVPPRPESRFGDASTMVAADPSEILSEVDDMMAQEEEQNFGPVVDVTPLGQAATGRPSAAGSTVAFAPNSVASDDLEEDEDGDETEGNDAWNDTILEEAPNPQSGNDEPLQQNEQLVDFLPEEDASSNPPEDVSVMGRTASSSVAIGGAQSLLQPEDPKEDDFGPVVDQTPTVQANVPVSALSTATHVTASELRSLEKEDNIEARSVDFDLEEQKDEAVVDYIPNIREKLVPDSVATVGQSQMTEEEEEEEEETTSKFGPVVDHLPTPRNSRAPSRGGSTVDALATVSEADSVGNERNGWEDDLDLEDASAESDRTDRISTRGSVRRAQSTTSDHDRSVSVRFDSTVRASYLKPPPVASSKGLHAASQNSSTSDGWEDDLETDAADASSIATGDASRMFDESLANAETPPSTPYNRPISSSGIADLSLLQPSMKECPSCANSKTMECPCVQKLLRVTKGAGSLTGTLLTADGDSLEVDFGEMLREEIAKRRLVEDEANTLRSLSASREEAAQKLSLTESSLRSDLDDSQKEKSDLLRKIEELQKERSVLRENSNSLSQELKQSRTLIDGLSKAKMELAQRESARTAEIEGLKKMLEERNEKLGAEKNLAAALVSAEEKLLEKDSQCQQLEAKVSSLQKNVSRAEADVQRSATQLESQVASYEAKLSRADEDLRKAQEALTERTRATEKVKNETEMALKASQSQVEKLTGAKDAVERQLSDLRSQYESEMKRQDELVDSRTKEVNKLEAELKSSGEQLNVMSTELQQQRYMANQSTSLSSELMSIKKERDQLQNQFLESQQKLENLQSLLNGQEKEQDAKDSSREDELKGLQVQNKKLQESLRVKERHVEELTSKLADAESEKVTALADAEAAQSSVWDLEEQLDTSNALLGDAESRADEVEAKWNEAKERLQQAEHRLEEANYKMKHLDTELNNTEKKLVTMTSDAQHQDVRASKAEEELARANEEIQRIRNEINSAASQKNDADSRMQDLQSYMSMQLQDAHRNADNAIREREAEIQRLRQEIKSASQQMNGQKNLQIELNNAREWVDLLEKEKGSLMEENEELLVQLGLRKGQMDEATGTIENLNRELDAVLLAVDAVNNGGDYNASTTVLSDATRSVVDTLFGLQTKYADLEAEMTSYASDRERGLEKRVEELEQASRRKDDEITHLRNSLSSTASSSDDNLKDLQQQVGSLELACKEKDHVIQAKSFEVKKVQEQLQVAEHALQHTKDSDTRDSTHQLQVTIARAERAENSLEHAHAELNKSQALVHQLELQIMSQDATLRDLQASQDSSRQQASGDAWDLQRRAQSLQDKISQKSNRISELERQVAALEQSNASLANRSVPPSGELNSLRNQVASLTSTLQAAHSSLSAREEKIEDLTMHVNSLEEKHSQHAAASTRLGHLSSGDDLESLRSQVVALATALERSETRRAETMDLLMSERRSSAESLRKVGESVQRFCNSVKLRDS